MNMPSDMIHDPCSMGINGRSSPLSIKYIKPIELEFQRKHAIINNKNSRDITLLYNPNQKNLATHDRSYSKTKG